MPVQSSRQRSKLREEQAREKSNGQKVAHGVHVSQEGRDERRAEDWSVTRAATVAGGARLSYPIRRWAKAVRFTYYCMDYRDGMDEKV